MKKQAVFLVLLLIPIFNNCVSHFPALDFEISNNLNLEKAFIIYYDEKTALQFPDRRKAIFQCMKIINSLKPEAIILKYFLVSENEKDINVQKSFYENTKIDNLFSQMASWNTNAISIPLSRIETYGDVHWLAENRQTRKIGFVSPQHLIFPDEAEMNASGIVAHVDSRITAKNEAAGMPLFIRWKKYIIPSLPLCVALSVKNMNIRDCRLLEMDQDAIKVQFEGASIDMDRFQLTKLLVPADKSLLYTGISMKDILQNNERPDLKNAIVVVGDSKAPRININESYSMDSNEYTLAAIDTYLEFFSR